MPFANSHILLRIGGVFGSAASTPADGWSVNLRFGVVGQEVTYDKDALATFVAQSLAATVTFHGSVNAAVGSSCFLTYAEGARIGQDGKYSPAQQVVQVSTVPGTAGNSPSVLPWSTADVISLRTIQQRGYASNGRIYYPSTSALLNPSTGRVSTGNVSNRLGTARTWIDSMNTLANTYMVGMGLIVASSVGNGLSARVTSIRGDGRLDGIERRENDAPAIWQSAVIA